MWMLWLNFLTSFWRCSQYFPCKNSSAKNYVHLVQRLQQFQCQIKLTAQCLTGSEIPFQNIYPGPWPSCLKTMWQASKAICVCKASSPLYFQATPWNPQVLLIFTDRKCSDVAGMQLDMQSALCLKAKWAGWTSWPMIHTSSTMPTIQAGLP